MAGVLFDRTARYSAVESWIYDTVIAPAVLTFLDASPFDLEADMPEGARVLDVGCGGGQVLTTLAGRRPDVDFTGVDLSPEQVGRANERAVGLSNCRAIVGNAQNLPFEGNSFDVVYSVASIKHWPDPQLGLSECVRVVRPGGSVLIIEADRGCLLEDARDFADRWRLPGPLRRAVVPLFRTYVAGQSLDLDDMRRLAGDVRLASWEVARISGTPGLSLLGTEALVAMRRAVVLGCAALIFASCSDIVDAEYTDYAAAAAAGAVERGWITTDLVDARDIREAHDLDTNERWLRFVAPASRWQPQIDIATPCDEPPPRLHRDWWPVEGRCVELPVGLAWVQSHGVATLDIALYAR